MSQDYVILLHGLARNARSMNVMVSELKRAGFGTVNYDYQSTQVIDSGDIKSSNDIANNQKLTQYEFGANSININKEIIK